MISNHYRLPVSLSALGLKRKLQLNTKKLVSHFSVLVWKATVSIRIIRNQPQALKLTIQV